MVKEAEVHASEDRQRREEVEARIQLDQVVYRAEKSIADAPADTDAEAKSRLQAAVDEAKKVIESGDASRMKSAHTELEQAAHKFAEAMYAKASAQTAGAGAAGGGDHGDGASSEQPRRDDAVDADFEEVKE